MVTNCKGQTLMYCTCTVIFSPETNIEVEVYGAITTWTEHSSTHLYWTSILPNSSRFLQTHYNICRDDMEIVIIDDDSL